jgi:hypothetical protein
MQKARDKERVKYERELRAKTEEIARLNMELTAVVTGGDSYPFVFFQPVDKDEASLMVFHQGKYPVYDVSIEITDTDKFNALLAKFGWDQAGSYRMTPEQLRELKRTKVTLNAGNVRPGVGMTLVDKWVLPPGVDVIRYGISIHARNGVFSQGVVINRSQGKWRTASRVYRAAAPGKKAVLLKEVVDPAFPRDASGKVRW